MRCASRPPVSKSVNRLGGHNRVSVQVTIASPAFAPGDRAFSHLPPIDFPHDRTRCVRLCRIKVPWLRVPSGLRYFLLWCHARAAIGNNDRLLTRWREVISPAGIARSFSKASSSRNLQFRDRRAKRDERSKRQKVDMQGNDTIEIVAPRSRRHYDPARPLRQRKIGGATPSQWRKRHGGRSAFGRHSPPI
ncbi:hypothetical protein ACVILL_003586 [Bradyrhizobium sp. USDA 3364]